MAEQQSQYLDFSDGHQVSREEAERRADALEKIAEKAARGADRLKREAERARAAVREVAPAVSVPVSVPVSIAAPAPAYGNIEEPEELMEPTEADDEAAASESDSDSDSGSEDIEPRDMLIKPSEAKDEAAASESKFDSDSDSDSGSEAQEVQAREAEALARAQSEAAETKAKKGRIAQPGKKNKRKQPAAQGRAEAEAEGKRLDGRTQSRGEARGDWDSHSLSLPVLLALLICALAWLVSNWSLLKPTSIVKPTESEEALLTFSRQGNVRAVRDLLNKQKVNVNYVTVEGYSALHWASMSGHAEVIDVLAAAGARVDYARPKDGTALFAASHAGHLKAVSSLIRANADPNQVMTDELAFSPLMIAAASGHALVVDALLAAGARVNYASPKDGTTALHLASQEGHLQTVSSLIRAGADPNQVKTNELVTSPLMIAAQQGHALVIDALVAAGARVDYARPEDGTTALNIASLKGHLQAVHSLIRANADPNQVMTDYLAFSPLMIAAFNGHALVIDALAAADARVDYASPKDGTTALYLASQFGKLQAVHSLIRAGADPNQVKTDELVTSPLMIAAFNGHALVIDALVAAGARVDYASPKDGTTALTLASMAGQLQAVSSLIRAGADPNQVKTDEQADSPLMIAAQKGHALIIDAFLAAGARVNYARPKDGFTALFAASQAGQLQAVRSLLLAGADPRLAAHDGTTALDAAKRNKHIAIVALLEARLAELAASP